MTKLIDGHVDPAEHPQQTALSHPFPAEKIKKVEGLDYVPVHEVIARMNEVLGVSGWDSEIAWCRRDELAPDWILAQVRVSAYIDGQFAIRDGLGGAKVLYKRGKPGEAVDLGNTFKSATSDALKKACQQLGVGLHLAFGGELEYEGEGTAVAPVASEPEITEAQWNEFLKNMASLTPASQGIVKEWWSLHGDGSASPVRSKLNKVMFAKLVERVATEIANAELGGVPDGAPF